MHLKKNDVIFVFLVVKSPTETETKIPRNFYIDGTYFEPQKQAKSRTLKMAELALLMQAEPAVGVAGATRDREAAASLS